MRNYLEASKLNEKIFDDVLESTSIPQWVMFRVVVDNKQKEVCKVRKMNDLVDHLTEGVNYVIIINEDIFDGLEESHKKIIFEDKLTGVTVSEHDALGYNMPDFNTYTGILQKYGHEEVIRINEIVQSLYDDKKAKEEAVKASKKRKNKKE